MKIRTRIALRITAVITAVMFVFVALNYIVSTRVRMQEFYVDLKKEGAARTELFLKAKVIQKELDKIDVSIYDSNYNLLYTDADRITNRTQEVTTILKEIFETKEDYIKNEGKFQTIGFIFTHQNVNYAVITSGHDNYGQIKMQKLVLYLLILSLVSLLAACALGYYLAKSVLKPVGTISDRMKDITANKLHLRLIGYNEKDEFGELAASFNKALDIIETSFESQKMFVSNVSHELRTPLATLIGEIDLSLLKERTAEEYRNTLINSRQDTSKLIKLLNGLLDLAKASYDENNMSMSPVKIDETLLEAVELVLKGNPEYDIKLIFNQGIMENTELSIIGNEYLLKTAFVNLMENNCKYSHNKTSTIEISLIGKRVILRFSDTGIGIPEDEIEHLFTPFFRGTNKKYVQGNGIGLALVKKVIVLHKGIINIHSVVDKGTTFTIEFTLN